MLAHEAGTRLGEDIESLHQMRVATRRMRAALSLFGTVLPVAGDASARGAGLARRRARCRSRSWTSSSGTSTRGPRSFRACIARPSTSSVTSWSATVADARAALLEALDSRRYERLVSALSSMLDQGPSGVPRLGHVAALEALPESDQRRHREAEKAVRRAHRTGVVDDFHRLRIRCKRLRYAIEFTGDLYGGDVKRYARQVASLQDELGLIQDAETAANRLQAIAFGEEGMPCCRGPRVFAMGMVSQRCAAEAVTRLAKLPPAKHFVNGELWDKAVVDDGSASSGSG